MEKIVAYCGMVCSDCDVYIATINDDQGLRTELAKRYTTAEHVAKPEDFYCEGCFKIKGEGCEVRQCASKKQHENCAACDNYSCDLLNKHFENSPESKVVLERIRGEKKHIGENSMELYWLDVAKKLQAMAQSGLAYSNNMYDTERYEELRNISADIMAKYTVIGTEKIKDLFCNETGYQTPKVDIRAVVFREGKILMVREKLDGAWALPGGWADIGLTPGEIAVKETREEAGFDVRPIKLLAVLDKKRHPHPPSPYHIYKIFIMCEIVGGNLSAGMETSEAGFFGRNELPELSVERNTESQVMTIFEFLDNPDKVAIFD